MGAAMMVLLWHHGHVGLGAAVELAPLLGMVFAIGFYKLRRLGR